MVDRRRVLWLFVLLLQVGAGCVISPKPEPPQVTFDPESTVAEWAHWGAGIVGGAGAASPAGAVVYVVNLDTEAPPATGVVAADGSFEVDLFVSEGQEVRVQVVDGQHRSAPFDLVIGRSGATPERTVRPLADCLMLDPAAEVVLSQGRHWVTMANDCSHEVAIEEPRLRRLVPGIALGTDQIWPVSLPSGQSLDVAIDADAAFNGLEVFFLEVSHPVLDRRPLSAWPLVE